MQLIPAQYRLPLIAVGFTALVFGLLGFWFGAVAPRALARAVPAQVPADVYAFRIGEDSTLSQSLSDKGFTSADIHDLVEAAGSVHDLSRINPGVGYRVDYLPGPIGAPYRIKFRFSPIESVEVTRIRQREWSVQRTLEKVESRLVTFTGLVRSSLWESAADAKMDPNLIAELTEIFAWQIDFAREVRTEDRWRLSVEQRMVKGQPFGWGRIQAAEYRNGGQVYTAVLFHEDGQDLGYFALDGSSLRRMFLKSPIPFGRISSRFQRSRFHPILKIDKPHLGVDYAAARGTPIRAVGEGTVLVASYSGGAGNMIKLRHNSTYQTAYKHLSGFAAGVHHGAHVRQGQIIGYVGATGLATGPHLHFEFYENGRFVDPMGKKFPSADPVPDRKLASFQQRSVGVLQTLPPWYQSPSNRN